MFLDFFKVFLKSLNTEPLNVRGDSASFALNFYTMDSSDETKITKVIIAEWLLCHFSVIIDNYVSH